MKKQLLTLVLIMLVCGCTDGDFDDFVSRYEWYDCSQLDTYTCSDGVILINDTIPGHCIRYIRSKCAGNEFVIVNKNILHCSTGTILVRVNGKYICMNSTIPMHTSANSTRLTRVPTPTLVTGYNHSEEGLWYPLRGTWITPRGNIISYCNFTINKSSLKLYGFSENITVTDTVFDANVSITNSTNIVIAYANITTNINITNLTGFKLIGNNNALYYINETPVSETIIGDTIVFSPPVMQPIPTWSVDSDENYIRSDAHINTDNISEEVIVDFNIISANVTITNSTNILVDSNKITANLTITNSNNIRVHRFEIDKEIIIKDLDYFVLRMQKGIPYYTNKTPIEVTVINETYIFSPLVEEPEPRLRFTAAPDDNIRSITLHYNAGGKEWKYITMYNATCHEIPCEFEGAYCLECEELRGD